MAGRHAHDLAAARRGAGARVGVSHHPEELGALEISGVARHQRRSGRIEEAHIGRGRRADVERRALVDVAEYGDFAAATGGDKLLGALQTFGRSRGEAIGLVPAPGKNVRLARREQMYI